MCVPDMYREGSFGLGAGKLRTIFKIVLPTAIPGILSGIILAIGRIVGETAALIYTAGTVAEAAGVMDSGRTLRFICIRCRERDFTQMKHTQQQSFF